MNDAVIFGGINQREALLKKSTGWDNGLSQDYNGKLGTWFADRLGAKQQLRNDMETKNEALELVREIEQSYEDSEERAQVVAMLRSQAAEIERLTCYATWYEEAMEASNADGYSGMSASQTIKDTAAERDQLKAKLEQLTIGDVELPEPERTTYRIPRGDSFSVTIDVYLKDQLIDYGNRRAAQAVLAERERVKGEQA